MGNKKYSLIKGTNVEVDSSNITGKLIKVNGIINQKTREQVNGTTIKSENINVNDVTVETGRLDFFGNLKQETRSGKNKFISLGNNTIAGITITENEDGTYNFSGTAAANIEHTAFINVEKSDIKNGSTYILSSTQTLPTGLSSRVERYTDSAWLGQFITSITSTIPTRTGVADTTDTTRFRFGVFISSGTTLNIQNVGFQLEEGTVATDYEQYGVSPSPDYPSRIRVVGDNVNLFDESTITAGVGISYDKGTEYSNDTIFSTDYISIKGIKNLVWNGTSNATHTWGALYDENKTYLEGVNVVGTKLTINNNSAKYIRLTFLNKYLQNILKIEEDTVSTGDKSYTSYGLGGINVETVGKNLFNKGSAIKGLYYNSKGQLPKSDNWYYANLKVAPNTKYIISGKTLDNTTAQFVEFDENMNFVNCIGNYKAVSTFITTNKTAYLGLSIPYYNGESNDLNTFQVELGDMVTEYKEYNSQSSVIELPEGQFLAKLGNYEDSIDNSGLIKKWIGKKVLNGTENIVYTANTGTRYAYRLDISDRMLGDNHYVCTHFKQKSHGGWDSDGIVSVNKTDTLIYIFVSNISTVDDFKAWLAEQYAAGTPVEIYYVLAKYTTVELSEVNQIKMNMYLDKLPMYLPITNVYSENTISPFFRLRYNYVPPLPNPEEASSISVVGDNINLLNNTSKSQTLNGITLTVNSDKSITINGTATKTFTVKLGEINLINRETYTLSGIKNGSSNSYRLDMRTFENGDIYRYWIDCPNDATIHNPTVTMNETITLYPHLRIQNGAVINNITVYPKIEKGAIATSYTNYGNGGFNYKAIGKNLFNENNIIIGKKINVNTGILEVDSLYNTTNFIVVNNKNITISFSGKNSNYNKISIGEYDKNYNFIKRQTNTDTTLLQYIFILSDNTKYIKYSYRNDVGIEKIQIEEGITATEYEPYKEQISTIELPNGEFMAKIGDVQDYIDSTGVLHKYIKKVVYDGTEIWSANMNSSWSQNKHVFGLNNKEVETKYGDATNAGNVLMSTHYITTNTSSLVFSETNCIAYYPANGKIMINHRNINNVTDFKAWLAEQYAAGTPVEVYYITNEPYTVDLSDEDYAKIQSVPMLIDYNNISLEPENNEFVLVYEGDEIEKSYDVTITNSGKLQPFGLTIDYNKTNLPLIAEADEASQIITGADGDVVLNTTYGPRMFEITAVTDDYLTAEEKEAKREEIREFLNAIKNKTAKLIIEPLNRTFEVKYSGVAEDNNLPKCVEFVIPLKSSNSYAISNETYSHIGSGDFDSDTVEPAGCKITITGPANVPNININGYDVIWNHILAEGQKLIIDSKKSTVTRVSSLGVKTNVMAYYSHQFPKIQKGVNFVEIISGIENSQLKIEWNDLLL